MKYEIYPKNTRFSFTDLDHPKLIANDVRIYIILLLSRLIHLV